MGKHARKPYHLNTLTVVRVERVMGKVGGLFITTRMRDTYIFLYILILKMILKKRRRESLEEKCRLCFFTAIHECAYIVNVKVLRC